MEICKINKILLSTEQINNLFSLIRTQKSYQETIESIYDYVLNNNIDLDTVGYSHLINGLLMWKGFSHGYLMFVNVIIKE